MNLHARVAASIEALDIDIHTNEPELLAQHYTEAGLTEQALDQWLAAAERASAHSAFAECVAHVAAALPLLTRIPEGKDRDLKEVDLQLARAQAERVLRGEGANETGEAYTRARELSERLSDKNRLHTALFGCARFHYHRFDIPQAREAAERMLSITNTGDDPIKLASSYALGAWTFLTSSKLVEARENFEHGLRACGKANFEAISAMSVPVDGIIRRGLMWANANLGFFDQSLRAAEDALELAEQRGDSQHICEARWALNGALLVRYDYRRLGDEVQRLHVIASTHSYQFHLAAGKLHSGIALGGLGQLEDGIDRILSAKAQFESLDNPMGLYHVRWSPLATYLAQAGRFEEALEFATQALTASAHTTFHTWALMRLGEVLRLAGDRVSADTEHSAENRLQEAIALARELSARGWEVEAAMSLAMLWRDQGKRQQAHRLLAPLYEWFTEGHDAGILKKAKALLDELS
jgi:tetratricopeptide (TPR) repeat protein